VDDEDPQEEELEVDDELPQEGLVVPQ